MNDTTKLTYTVKEVSRMLGIPQSTLYRHVKDPECGFRPIMAGSTIRIPKVVVDRMIAGER
ncbi:Helix-turn-helix domain protein [Corynebacterium ciconiae DSM 44920]|uniref:helix-turn-helix domain-containing protein n=1 Tax=Corynebacterium ciconiae TaxID=227319 RepID=UPI0026481F3A|nr:helix-turn-helix domain-containing protein [Corynebacterium ciconiae]WKD60887.1 Helix-turn-helix domain protein [Corynebacterium ciconiae DSM 44920]